MKIISNNRVIYKINGRSCATCPRARPRGTVTVRPVTVTIPGGTMTVRPVTVPVPAGTMTVRPVTVPVPAGTMTVPPVTVPVPAGTVPAAKALIKSTCYIALASSIVPSTEILPNIARPALYLCLQSKIKRRSYCPEPSVHQEAGVHHECLLLSVKNGGHCLFEAITLFL